MVLLRFQFLITTSCHFEQNKSPRLIGKAGGICFVWRRMSRRFNYCRLLPVGERPLSLQFVSDGSAKSSRFTCFATGLFHTDRTTMMGSAIKFCHQYSGWNDGHCSSPTLIFNWPSHAVYKGPYGCLER